jgi:hypothetical protein
VPLVIDVSPADDLAGFISSREHEQVATFLFYGLHAATARFCNSGVGGLFLRAIQLYHLTIREGYT